MREEIKNARHQKAMAKAVEEMAKYGSVAELRKANLSLYMFLRRHDLLSKVPKSDKITKLTYTDEDLLQMAEEYPDYESLRDGNMKLMRALKTRGILPEHLAYVAPAKKESPPKKPKAAPKEPEPKPIDIVPKKFSKGNRKGPYACFRATLTPTGFICGRCREEFAIDKRHYLCSDLCRDCYNAKVMSDKEGSSIVLNIKGNVKDEYCHIVLNLPDGPMYVGIEVSEEERKKIILGGYSFLLK